MKVLVSDELWAVVEPLLPKERPSPKGGRPRVPDRAALTGIIFVLQSGIPWGLLPLAMGLGAGRLWTLAAFRQKGGPSDRAESNG